MICMLTSSKSESTQYTRMNEQRTTSAFVVKQIQVICQQRPRLITLIVLGAGWPRRSGRCTFQAQYSGFNRTNQRRV